MTKYFFLIVLLLGTLALSPTTYAANTCTFNEVGHILTLTTDCTTDETIIVPEDRVLDGAHHTITAMDPNGSHFIGAVVKNGGDTAHVTRLIIDTSNLADVCDSGDDRLRGILFESAQGTITQNRIKNINQGVSGCQEGNAIEVRNAPFDGTHPNTLSVEIAYNEIENYQKTGILANGDVNVYVHNNEVGESVAQTSLAANTMQIAFGATGTVMENSLEGNQWLGASNFSATAMLVFLADVMDIGYNEIKGNSDVGIYIDAENGSYHHNLVYDFGEDGTYGDYGIFDFGVTNSFKHNDIRGFDLPFVSSSITSNGSTGVISASVYE